ncbi:MAG TPA: ferritin-like domain-containing protein [Mucilaginibacter sp.]|jgi:ferritin-like metal-binding protein YciE
MEAQTMKGTNLKLKEFFVHQLKDIYWTEKKLGKALPRLQDAATTQELKDAFGTHRNQTQEHVDRLEKVFGMVNEKAESIKSQAIANIVDEGQDIIDETERGTAQRDTGLIFAGQKAEHYKIATYGGLVSLAKVMGYNNVADVLFQTLTEEKEAGAHLTWIAENNINYQLN